MKKFTTEQILVVVLREMTAYGDAWRNNWSDFDGRTLQRQLDGIAAWAASAVAGNANDEYTRGSDFFADQED